MKDEKNKGGRKFAAAAEADIGRPRFMARVHSHSFSKASGGRFKIPDSRKTRMAG
ncbi:MAG TPA: hypothetical protein VJW77_16295 [Terriglobia bacterium]|nr:hypothetical protein [Terriglobia bacterium]